MRPYTDNYGCIECFTYIDDRVFHYSTQHYYYPFCRDCQGWYQELRATTSVTDFAFQLYFALKVRGVPAELEKYDGYKSIDIAVPMAKVNIEVDGCHHALDGRQALSDLRRTLHSFRKGYFTLRIPNSLADYDLEQAADLITEFLNVSTSKTRSRYY